MFFMNLRLSDVYLARHDDASRVRTLEEARTFAGEKHPEVLHALGSTYATLEPPQAEKAVQMLKAFDKKVCKTGAAKTYKHQCEETNTLLQKFAM